MGEKRGINSEDYSLLKDFRLEIEAEDGTFCLCFWIYLMNSTPFPSTVIGQVHSDITGTAPFLVLNEKKKMMLLPLCLLHKEAPNPGDTTTWKEVPNVSSEIELPLEEWIHVGCEVSTDFVRLHIDGELMGEKPLTSLFEKDSDSSVLRKISLVSIDEDDDGVQGYIHKAKFLPTSLHIEDHRVKDPPLQLTIDNSSVSEIEEDGDGVWSIVGGKASCRRKFSLDIVLLDPFGQPVNEEVEVFASLLYADNGAPVEKTNDEEAPLLTSYDGFEFASCDRPLKLWHGRAPFKLKISQLSSKCDNRLFRIRFDIPKFGRYPFLEALSHPIRCISRSRNTRPYLSWKKSNSAISPLIGSQLSELDDLSFEPQQNTVHEVKPSPLSKRVRLGREKISSPLRADSTLERPDGECNSYARAASQVKNPFGASLERRPGKLEEPGNSSSDSERSSTEARSLDFKCMSSIGSPISDLSIFRYCLGGLTERSLLLKEIATSASNEELLEFAHQISLFSGCSHHRHQIIIAKRLIEEGTKVWHSISQNNHHVHWEAVIFDIEEQFMKIACCGTRSLTQQDFELLRRIAGCGDYLAQEHFEKMWCWLYPVAFTLSRDWIKAMWSSMSPMWIEGFVTKEEAESSLQGLRGLQEPGTFILRFPTSRSWPHPDAGSLIVTYVGSDYTLHNRLLSIDYISSSTEREMNVKPLQDMLLAEPELSQLARITRSR